MTLADGPRSFPTAPRFGVGDDVEAIAVGDVNDDGRSDLAAANKGSDDVSILVADGAGTLAPEVRIAVEDGPNALAFAEVTSDAHVDLIVANSSPKTISVLSGNGDGTFAVAETIPFGALLTEARRTFGGTFEGACDFSPPLTALITVY